MSTWTKEKHERAQVLSGGMTSPGEDTKASLADALDEIERLRALTTITNETVERAVAAHKAHSQTMHPRENAEYAACAECGWAFGWQGPTDPPGAQRVHEHAIRAALEAALTPKAVEA